MRPTTLFIIFAVGALGFLAYAGKQIGVKAPAMPKLEMPNIQLPGAMSSLMKDDEQQSNSNVTAYKWQDSEGQWHYGNEPPKGVKAEALIINTEQNIVASPRSQTTNSDSGSGNSTGQDSENLPSALPAPYQEAQKMLGLQPAQPHAREMPR